MEKERLHFEAFWIYFFACTLLNGHRAITRDVSGANEPATRDVSEFYCDNNFLQNKTDATCFCPDYRIVYCAGYGINLNSVLNILVQIGYNRTQILGLDISQSTTTKQRIFALEHFTELELLLMKSEFAEAEYNLEFNSNTFRGCNKLGTLRMNVRLRPDSCLSCLQEMVPPLVHLRELDLSNTVHIGYHLANSTLKGLSHEIKILKARSFQTLTDETYLRKLDIGRMLNGVYSSLTVVDFSFNDFIVVAPGWFHVMPNLKFLDLSHNILTQTINTPFIIEILMHPAIQVFNFSVQLKPDGSASPGKSNHVTQTTISPDILVSGIGAQMPYSFRDCINNCAHGNISRLFGNESNEYACRIFRSCFSQNLKDVPCDNLPDISEIIDPNCFLWTQIPLGRNILTLDLSYVDMVLYFDVALPSMNLCFYHNNLKTLNLSSGSGNVEMSEQFEKILSGDIQVGGLEFIEELSLSNSNLAPNFLYPRPPNFPGLKTLDLSNNVQFYNWNDLSICSDFGFHSVETLDLSGTHCLEMSPAMFEKCSKLRLLNLSNCGLDSETLITLRNVPNIEVVDLSMNNMQYINSGFRNELDCAKKQSSLSLGMSNNPFKCLCDNESQSFVYWVTKQTDLILDLESTECESMNGLSSLADLNYKSLRNECWHLTVIILSVASTIALVILVLLAILIYRRRFRLKYKCFKLQQFFARKRCHVNTDESETNPAGYEHDAFVSYSSEDRFWVHDVLMKTLEETYGFKLVIHYRDFLLGRNIQHSIDESIENCRDFILVITENFLESDWCQMEMEAAYRASLLRHRNLAIIILGEVPANITNPTARLLLDTYSYLQWKIPTEKEKTDVHRQKLFWSQLVHLLYGNDRLCGCCLPTGPRAIGYREVRDFAGQEHINQDDGGNAGPASDGDLESTYNSSVDASFQ